MTQEQISTVKQLQTSKANYQNALDRLNATPAVLISLTDAANGKSIFTGTLPLLAPAGEATTDIEQACQNFITELKSVLDTKLQETNAAISGFDCSNPIL